MILNSLQKILHEFHAAIYANIAIAVCEAHATLIAKELVINAIYENHKNQAKVAC